MLTVSNFLKKYANSMVVSPLRLPFPFQREPPPPHADELKSSIALVKGLNRGEHLDQSFSQKISKASFSSSSSYFLWRVF